MSEATLNPPSLEQINRDLATTVSEEMQKVESLTQQRDDLSAEIERCHRLLDVYYGESLETTSVNTLEDRIEALLAEIKGMPSRELIAACQRLITNLHNGKPLTGAFAQIRQALLSQALNKNGGAT